MMLHLARPFAWLTHSITHAITSFPLTLHSSYSPILLPSLPLTLSPSYPPFLTRMLHLPYHSCACAFNLQPLLLLRDLSFPSFHTAFLRVLHDVLNHPLGIGSLGGDGVAWGRKTDMVQMRGKGTAVITVNNSTDVYKKKGATAASVAEERTKSMLSYLRMLECVDSGSLSSNQQPYRISDSTGTISPSENDYRLSVRQALCNFVLCVGEDSTIIELNMQSRFTSGGSGGIGGLGVRVGGGPIMPHGTAHRPSYPPAPTHSSQRPVKDASHDSSVSLLHPVYW